ncbi:hypothetical protein WICPIJ_009482 [Wickerhamomyces pijperi]|uniref:F-actin-capping protein subunit alpha n=1 Tax=Wickerhamomyces pijperi TaxID=599730 RepID=A0A9P8TDQ5_WICPI|nr:hypothetical protein WICPIJ_009482 [Wickerhamomyces pijperi]
MSNNLSDIIDSLISDSPSTELTQVVKDLKQISTTHNITDDLELSLKKHDLFKFTPVQLPNGTKDRTIISKHNLKQGWFVDSLRGYKFQYDHLNRSVLQCESIDKDDKLVQLDAKIRPVLESIYSDFYYILIPSDEEDQDQEVRLILKSIKLNNANFYNGEWTSEHLFDLESSELLESKIKVDAHYYEDGNVRLIKESELSQAQKFSNGVTGLFDVIVDLENSLQLDLNKSFVQLNENQFKKLRRLLPVTRSKVQWGKNVHNYKLNQ